MFSLKQICSSDENKICKNLSMLLKIHALFMIATGMSNIFLNIFIWKVSNDIRVVIEYNIYFALVVPIIFALGGWISKKRGLRINLILGMLIYTLFYLITFIFRDSINQHIPLIGITRGIAAGFYFISFNVLGFDFSTDKNRDYFFGILGLVNSTTSMVTPFVSGYIISYYSGTIGYQIIFVASFFMFLVGSIMSFYLPNNFKKSDYHLKSVFLLTFKDSNWTKIMFSELIRGIRDMIMSFILSILIFINIAKESAVGNYSLITNLVATLACFASGILINAKNRTKYLFFGIIATAIVSYVFLIKINMVTLWIFGIVTVISVNIYYICHNTISLAVISAIPNSREKRIEAIIVKEMFLNIGRWIGLIVFLFLVSGNATTDSAVSAKVIFVIGLSQILVWLLLRKIDITKIKHKIIPPSVEFEHKLLGFRTFQRAVNSNHGIH